MRKQLTPEQIEAIEQKQRRMQIQLMVLGMKAGIIPVTTKIVYRRTVRRLKTDVAKDNTAE